MVCAPLAPAGAPDGRLPEQLNGPLLCANAEQRNTALGDDSPVLYFTETVSPGSKPGPFTVTEPPFDCDAGETVSTPDRSQSNVWLFPEMPTVKASTETSRPPPYGPPARKSRMPGTFGAERTPPSGQIAFTCAPVHGFAW